jgi:hypothetical protein
MCSCCWRPGGTAGPAAEGDSDQDEEDDNENEAESSDWRRLAQACVIKSIRKHRLSDKMRKPDEEPSDAQNLPADAEPFPGDAKAGSEKETGEEPQPMDIDENVYCCGCLLTMNPWSPTQIPVWCMRCGDPTCGSNQCYDWDWEECGCCLWDPPNPTPLWEIKQDKPKKFELSTSCWKEVLSYLTSPEMSALMDIPNMYFPEDPCFGMGK